MQIPRLLSCSIISLASRLGTEILTMWGTPLPGYRPNVRYNGVRHREGSGLEKGFDLSELRFSRRNEPSTAPGQSRVRIESRGGDDGIRTHDPHVANVMLSQLSYIPTKYACAQEIILLRRCGFVKYCRRVSTNATRAPFPRSFRPRLPSPTHRWHRG